MSTANKESKTKEESNTRKSLVRVLAAYDRESDDHKKIYEDLAEE